MHRRLLLLVVCAATIGTHISFNQITPQEANILLGRGINLGNTLEPPDEGEWNNPLAEEYYFDSYVDAGFNSVRIPVSWYGHTQKSSPYTVDDTWMDRVEQVVDWGLSRNLVVVLNAHHEEWLKEKPSTENLERFDSIWSQIAMRFKDKSDSLFFEMINEPHPMHKDTVDNLNKRILSIIRNTNPTRIVLFSGHIWSGADQLIEAEIPEDDYLIGYFHSYDPWSFAGEGNGTWGTTGDVGSIDNMFSKVSAWSTENNIPVYLGEFGAVKACDYNSRMKHYATYTELALKHGFSYAVWDDGGNFGIYIRNSKEWNETKDIVANYSDNNPTGLSALNNNAENVTLTWNNRVQNIDSVVIDRGYSPNALSKLYVSDEALETYIDTAVNKLTYYYYRVSTYYQDSVRFSYPTRAYTTYVSSLQESSLLQGLQLYPNFVETSSFLSLPNELGAISVQIIDVNGKLVKKLELPVGGGQIDMTDLPTGLYFINILKGNIPYTIQFQKI